MIFSPNIVKGIAQNSFDKLNLMLVYSGSKPSIANYIANFNSTYSWTGSLLLQGYLKVDLAGVNDSENQYRIFKNSVSGTRYGAFSRQAGAASWAVLFSESLLNDLLQFDAKNKTVRFLRNISVNDSFMMIPVSELNGDGVLQFNSTNFSHPAEEDDTIESFSLRFEKI